MSNHKFSLNKIKNVGVSDETEQLNASKTTCKNS